MDHPKLSIMYIRKRNLLIFLPKLHYHRSLNYAHELLMIQDQLMLADRLDFLLELTFVVENFSHVLVHFLISMLHQVLVDMYELVQMIPN